MKNLGVLSNEDLLTLYNDINKYIKALEDSKKEVMEPTTKDDK
jgi:hypothetical protein